MLELSRIEAGEAPLAQVDFEVGELLNSLVRLWRARAGDLGVALCLDLEALPAPCFVKADKGKLEQVLTNLISNALKFSPSGGEARIRARGEEREDRVWLGFAVVDDGPGVPAAEKHRIFEPYAQTDAGRQAGGAGLGLAICAGHVRLMGGDIRVDDAPCGGAAFHIDLEVAKGLPSASAPERVANVDALGLRVLAAEDNETNRRVLQVLLEPAGVELVFAENGAEALEAFQTQAFDLVLMDANMPVMGGMEAVQAIRRLAAPASGVPIHMLTANAFETDVQAYFAAGVDGVLAKPIDVRALYALLEDVLTSREPCAQATA